MLNNFLPPENCIVYEIMLPDRPHTAI